MFQKSATENYSLLLFGVSETTAVKMVNITDYYMLYM